MKKLVRNTDDTIVPLFSQHGTIESRIEGNILINEATGPFNAEIIYALQEVQSELLDVLAVLRNWGQIYIFHQSALCSPDTIEAMHGYISQKKGTISKPAATAFVMDRNVEGRLIMGPHYRQVYEKAELNFALFVTEAEAREWVEQTLKAV